MESKKALVVYYARRETTRSVACRISRALDCDVERIAERGVDRRGALGYLRSGFDVLLRRPSLLAPMRLDPADYDVVIVGTPIWNASVAAPVRSWLEANRARLERVAFFCTHGGSGSARVLRQMEEICGKPPIVTLVLRTQEVEHETAAAKIRSFAGALGASASGRIRLRPVSLRPVHAG